MNYLTSAFNFSMQFHYLNFLFNQEEIHYGLEGTYLKLQHKQTIEPQKQSRSTIYLYRPVIDKAKYKLSSNDQSVEEFNKKKRGQRQCHTSLDPVKLKDWELAKSTCTRLSTCIVEHMVLAVFSVSCFAHKFKLYLKKKCKNEL